MNQDAIFKVLASPIRREILSWLKDTRAHFPDSDYPAEFGASAGQINRRSGLSQSTVSSHLSMLLHADLISRHKSGTWIFFKRNEGTIRAFLEEMGCRL
jgi:DNA-binding transcriptional ArsR family regulator